MTQEGAAGNLTLIGKTNAIFGSFIKYGVYHDSSEPRTKMPRRNFSEPSDRRLLIFKKNITDNIIRSLNKEGIKVDREIFNVSE